MNKNKGYVGSVPNSGPAVIKAPHMAASPKGKGVVLKGGDLRSGKSAK